jgi:hypothetical protein
MSLKYKLTIFVVFVAFFLSSLFAVNHIRKDLFFSYSPAEASISISAEESIGPVPQGEKIGSVKSLPSQFVSRTFLS